MTSKLFSINALKILIGVGLGIFGRFLPPFSLTVPVNEELISMGFPLLNGGQDILISLSAQGMTMLTIFAGTIFLWTAVTITWSSLLAVLLVATSGFLPVAQVLNMFMGNPVIVMIFFLFVFVGIVIENNLAAHLVEYVMTREIVQGRPWLIVGAILIATFLVGQISQTLSTLLLWASLYTIFKTLGYKKGDKFVTIMIIYVPLVSLLALCANPITGGALPFLLKVQEVISLNPETPMQAINILNYYIFGLTISILCIFAFFLLIRYVFKMDVSRLKNFDVAIFKENKLPPLDVKQKVIIFMFFMFLVLLFLPSALGKENALGMFLNKNSLVSSLFMIFLATAINVKGRPVAELSESLKFFPWNVYFLLAVAFMFGSVLVNKATNVPVMIQYGFGELFGGMGNTGFIIAIILVASLLTNFIHSGALGLITIPVVITLVTTFDFAVEPILVCYFFALLFAILTPAASPYAALLYGNDEWVTPKDILIHGSVATIVFLAILIVIGVPLATFMFG